MDRIRANYPEIFARCQETYGCFIHAADPRGVFEVTEEEREAFWEKLYGEPGFGIWMGNFRDVLTDRQANKLMSDFLARKIRQRVKDPAVAEKLIPKNHGFGTRRVPLESGYFEVYNQPNVELVDLTETPIECITPTGIKTSAREYEFDMIIYATGFDAITGAFDRIDIRGVDNVSLKDKPVELTAREYSLVEFMALHRGEVVTRTQLYEHLFDENESSMSNLLDVHVSNVRKKLGAEFIATRRGHGYCIEG